MNHAAAPPKPGFLENLIFGTTIDRVPALIPGGGTRRGAGCRVLRPGRADQHRLGIDGLVSFILVAIVVGMIIRNTLGLSDVFAPGVAFSLKKLLRLGIILLGIRLSIIDVLEIGGFGIPIVL